MVPVEYGGLNSVGWQSIKEYFPKGDVLISDSLQLGLCHNT